MDFLVMGLAVFAFTHILVYTYGPYDLVLRFREKLGIYWQDYSWESKTELGKMFLCPVCLGFWLSFPVTVIGVKCIELLYPFAALAIVILLSGVIDGDS